MGVALREQAGVVADGGDPMNTFRDLERAASVHVPLEQIKFGHRAQTSYTPPEAGESKAVPAIQEVMDTWARHYASKA